MIDRIIDFEAGLLDEEEVRALFQQLIDTGLAWTMQGSYGRQANAMIETGLCVPYGGQHESD